MLTTTQTFIPVDGKSFDAVRSLCWQGDQLMDWTTGLSYGQEGPLPSRKIAYGYRFNSAIASVSGRYTVLYERCGTKALLLDEGRVLRELNRSYYCAEVYEYPVQFGMLPDGIEILLHCPKDYNRLQIEEVATGHCLTERPAEPAIDFFHSRLAFNPSGTRILNAGWVWHPVDDLRVYQTAEVLANPSLLDGRGDLDLWSSGILYGWEGEVVGILSAAFCGDDQLLLTTAPEIPGVDPEEERPSEAPTLIPGALARYDFNTRTFLSVVQTEEVVGTLYAVGTEYALGLYDHPKLIHIDSGRVVHRWADLSTGNQSSSILHNLPLPPFAWDAKRHRFAVADENGITTVHIEGV